MSPSKRSDRPGDYPLECDHCHYPIPNDPVETDDGYVCSTACHDAVGDDTTMAEPSAYKRIATGVEPLDSLVPTGVPSNSFLTLVGEAGTRWRELLTELVWRALERGEPAAILTATTPPTAVLERFFEAGWNVLPALEDERLRVIDCFTHRLEDRETFLERRNRWIEFVGETAADSIVTLEEPTATEPILSGLNETLDDLEMTETGLVTIDSLAEFEANHRHAFVAELRASVCKARYVPIIAGTVADIGSDSSNAFADGIVDLRLADHLESAVRHRQLSVRKLTGAQSLPQWIAYEYDPPQGLLVLGSAVDVDGRSTVSDSAELHGRQ
ncbi:RAD55 family ATPase [Natronorubrum sulfidifaciens]|uniref:Recombinase A n=1 Tax=Natronorubrum sulfidifaciens JCM 14089 TaxID=1230460 RepID=L9WDP1_9EURY|nr:ATPase domain-containing protein [Natronorubrum sulfidifaciens]ELY47569.1 recombinase A [Natronorubrum sulfidifaciens JCM 14089]